MMAALPEKPEAFAMVWKLAIALALVVASASGTHDALATTSASAMASFQTIANASGFSGKAAIIHRAENRDERTRCERDFRTSRPPTKRRPRFGRFALFLAQRCWTCFR